MKSLRITLILTLLLISVAEAHQPRIVYDRNNNQENPIIITQPEISRAYYGELKGQEDNYMIIAREPFKLYLNILTPYNLNENRKDFKVEVRDFENRKVLTLDGTQAEWTLYFEEFARDYYMKGPETSKELKGGVYYMKVSNSNNQGKYSLAAGEKETFPLNEIFKTYYAIPRIKTEFFNQPWYKVYINFVGIALAITLAIIITILLLLKKIFGKKKKAKIPPKRLTH
ncbi:MAG: hypothetical protein ABIH63_02095 [archaeon]